MVICPRCDQVLAPEEKLLRFHECPDGQFMAGCPQLRTFVTAEDHTWLHEWAEHFDAKLVGVTGHSGEVQPLLWQMK